MNRKKLTDYLDINFLQHFQDAFSQATGMASICTDLEGPVTNPSNFTDFCIHLTRKNPLGLKRCIQCDLQGGESSSRTGEPAVYYCHAGLMDFAAPIIVDGKQVGSFQGGQVLTHPPDEDKFRQIALELGIDPEEYISALSHVKVVSEEQIKSSAQLLYLTVNQISKVQTQFIKLELSHQVIQEDVTYIAEQVQKYKEAVDILSDEQKNLLLKIESFNIIIENINKIIKPVAELAQKIQIISVNASVEAARSGLEGRGFAVIAQEIRRLADETSKTVNQIQRYTQEILDATQQVLKISHSSTDSLDVQVERLESIFPRLEHIIHEMTTLYT